MVERPSRVYMLRVRMSDDEHEALLAISAAAGLTSSDYLRQHIRQTFAVLAPKPKKKKGAR